MTAKTLGPPSVTKNSTIRSLTHPLSKALRDRQQSSIVPTVPMRHRFWLSFQTALMASATLSFAAAATAAPETPSRGEETLANYFRAETAKLSDACLSDIRTLDDWNARREPCRQQLLEMLGLSPFPPRTDLKPIVTGTIEQDLFVVENLHFQSLPGLYVSGNLYVPRRIPKPVPAILYVCGHGPVIRNGVSYGNKAAYQHHGAWFARNGYACLVIDTLQLGEIEGIHHGIYREGMWWWNSRGYTPAGVEAWNSIRALDYLQSRPEVDPNRLGVTGRSGGGAYSWWLAAVDDRIKAAAPIAGITDLQNHVVDGTVEGHCDCMFVVNTYRWDYPLVAALVAPRPLLIGNSDKDSIFPLNGVVRLHAKLRNVYDLYKAPDKLGLLITEGPHRDTQDLQLPVLRWFNRHLKGEDPVIETAAVKIFEPEQLKVFDRLPADSLNPKIQDSFVPRAEAPAVPQSIEQWAKHRDSWLTGLKQRCFRGWPDESEPLELMTSFSQESRGFHFRAYDFQSQSNVPLRLFVMSRAGLKTPRSLVLHVLDEDEWQRWAATVQLVFGKQLGGSSGAGTAQAASTNLEGFIRPLMTNNQVLAWFAPRGVGPNAWDQGEKKQIQIRRRFMLLGQTLDSMRVWDIRRAVQAIRSIKDLKDAPLRLQGKKQMGVNVLYAALFEPKITRLDLWEVAETQESGPDYLNILRVLDIPQAVAIAAERSVVRLHQAQVQGWDFPASVAHALQWNETQFAIELAPLTYSK
jgi:Prolyl oligopeptidase family